MFLCCSWLWKISTLQRINSNCYQRLRVSINFSSLRHVSMSAAVLQVLKHRQHDTPAWIWHANSSPLATQLQRNNCLQFSGSGVAAKTIAVRINSIPKILTFIFIYSPSVKEHFNQLMLVKTRKHLFMLVFQWMSQFARVIYQLECEGGN